MEDRRVVIIGFDGATWSLIKPWAERGVLPTFAKLMKKGSWGYLQSTMPPVTFPAWKSFSTGKNPGKFGLFAHIKLEKGKLKVCNAETVKDNREMWDELSDHDKKVAVIGVPITYPPKKVNGIMVSGPFSVGHNYTYPKDLENKLRKKYNYDPFPEEFLMSKEKARELGLKPMATFRYHVAEGCEPEYMGVGPAVAIPRVLKLANMSLDQIDLIELNEAFAAQAVYCIKKLGIKEEITNVNGGAIALGHPLGASGARIAVTLLYEMQRREARLGIAALCIGGGMGIAMLFERD